MKLALRTKPRFRVPGDFRPVWYAGDGANIYISQTAAAWGEYGKNAPYPDAPVAYKRGYLYGTDIANTKLYRSRDGLTWTEVGSNALYGAVPLWFVQLPFGRLLLAGGLKDGVAYSDSGAAWTIPAFAADFEILSSPKILPSGRIVIGGRRTSAPTYAATAYSDDGGASWARADFGGTNSRRLIDLLQTDAGTLSAIVGCFNSGTGFNEMRVWSSADGVIWSDDALSDAPLFNINTVGHESFRLTGGRQVFSEGEWGGVSIRSVRYTDDGGATVTTADTGRGPLVKFGNKLNLLKIELGNLVLRRSTDGAVWSTFSTVKVAAAPPYYGLAVPRMVDG